MVKSCRLVSVSKSPFLKEGMILLCQSILEMRRTSHLHGSGPFAIPLTCFVIKGDVLLKELNF